MFKPLLAVVLIIFYVTGTFAQSLIPSDSDCGYDSELDRLEESFQFFDSKCLTVPVEERCSCLANEKESNVFITAIDDNNKILAYQEKIRRERTDHFWDVYKQMIHGAAFQSEILFSKDSKLNKAELPSVTDGKVVGCPPTQIAEEFKTKLKDGIEDMKDLQQDALDEKRKELNKCIATSGAENCRWLEKQVAKLEEDVKKKKSADFDRFCNTAKVDNTHTYSQIQLKSAMNWYKQNPSVQDSKGKLRKIECMLLLSESDENAAKNYKNLNCPDLLGYVGMWDSFTSNDMTVQFEAPQAVPKASKGLFGINNLFKSSMDDVVCTLDSRIIMDFMNEVEKDKIKVEEEKLSKSITFASEPDQQKLDFPSECEDDGLCKSFERTNNAAFNAMKDDHKLQPGQCVSYPVFLLKKGVPGDLFLKELAAIPEDRADKLGELLRPPKVVNNEVDRQRMRFLKANPLLFKLTQDAKTRENLARELQMLAKSPDNKTPAQKMDNYLKFMKGPVKTAMGTATFKDGQAYMCEQMINHFTSVVMATDLPENSKKSRVPLLDAILSCKVALNNLTSVTDTRNLSDYNDLFRKVEGDLPELTDEEEFAKINKEECEGFDEWASKNCAGKNKTHGECAEAYRNQKPGSDGQDAVIAGHNVTTNLGTSNYTSASRYSRDSGQDHSYKKSWRRRVGKNLKTPAVPFKGKTDEYTQSVEDDQAHVAAAASSVPASSSVNTSRSLPSYAQEGSTEPQAFRSVAPKSVNPGQIIPSYQEPGTFIPEKLGPTSNVTNAIQDYNWIAPEKRIEKLNQVKDYIQSNDLKNLDEDVEEEKISEIDKEIVKQKELSSSGTNFSTNVNTSVGAATGAANGGVMNGGGQVGGAANISAGQTGHGAVNDAIVKIHESIPVQVLPGVVSEKELKGVKLEVTKELFVELGDLSELSESRLALETYLRANLDVEDLKEEKIIAISDKNGGKDAANLIYRVKFENGKLVIQSMPGTLPVKRSATLKHLNFNLEEFKGLKKKKAI